MTTDQELGEIRRDVLEEFACKHGRRAAKQLLDELASDFKEDLEGDELYEALEAIQVEIEHLDLNCDRCHRPEAQHVWLSREEFEVWRPEPGEAKEKCNVANKRRQDGGIYKVYSEAKAPVDPCDVDFMKDISS